jgi:hypothetical protein
MNGLRSIALALALVTSAAVLADGIRSPAPEGASLYFIAPADGAVVSGPFTVKFGLKGMGVAPAGVDAPNTGHHHLLINLEEAVNPEVPLPATDQVRSARASRSPGDVRVDHGHGRRPAVRTRSRNSS